MLIDWYINTGPGQFPVVGDSSKVRKIWMASSGFGQRLDAGNFENVRQSPTTAAIANAFRLKPTTKIQLLNVRAAQLHQRPLTAFEVYRSKAVMFLTSRPRFSGDVALA